MTIFATGFNGPLIIFVLSISPLLQQKLISLINNIIAEAGEVGFVVVNLIVNEYRLKSSNTNTFYPFQALKLRQIYIS
jgi:hypothetical protein